LDITKIGGATPPKSHGASRPRGAKWPLTARRYSPRRCSCGEIRPRRIRPKRNQLGEIRLGASPRPEPAQPRDGRPAVTVPSGVMRGRWCWGRVGKGFVTSSWPRGSWHCRAGRA